MKNLKGVTTFVLFLAVVNYYIAIKAGGAAAIVALVIAIVLLFFALVEVDLSEERRD